MKTQDGLRRRTGGGVFLTLLKVLFIDKLSPKL